MNEHSEIASRVGALAVHVDAHHWDELVALFSATVRIDYSSLFGGEAEIVSREALVQRWRQLLPGFTRTTHIIGTPHIVLKGSTAQVTASVLAQHFIHGGSLGSNNKWVVGGRYEMLFERLSDIWTIASLTLAGAWSEGNADLPRIAMERVHHSA
jgi:hypothetical protein